MSTFDEITFLGAGKSGATFSPDRSYRYCLWRRWREEFVREIDDSIIAPDNHDICAFIGLNPSTADENEDDPTIRRCIAFAKSWGFGGIAMLNLFAFRATDPAVMKSAPQAVGEWNDECLKRVTSVCGQTIACWGTHGAFLHRGALVRSMLFRRNLCHLGLSKDGHPKHPLYLRADTTRENWQ